MFSIAFEAQDPPEDQRPETPKMFAKPQQTTALSIGQMGFVPFDFEGVSEILHGASFDGQSSKKMTCFAMMQARRSLLL